LVGGAGGVGGGYGASSYESSSYSSSTGGAGGVGAVGGAGFDLAGAAFNSADSNRDGVLSSGEFNNFVQGGL
ncbi:hypothetical protein AB0854_29505, partial [Bacillus cereus]